MNTKETLIAARTLLSKPENWTQGAYAKNCENEPTPIFDHTASCFCMLGALRKVSKDEYHIWNPAYHALCMASNFTCVEDFNDSANTTHADVLKMFDSVIEKW